MSIVSQSEFAEQVMKLATPNEEFEPTAVYDRDGDCVEFVAKPHPFRAERVDDLVTVYYSQVTGEIMGSLIKGVSKFRDQVSEKMPGFRIQIKAGRVKLEHLFLARLWSEEFTPGDMPTVTYQKLIEVSRERETEVEGDLCMA